MAKEEEKKKEASAPEKADKAKVELTPEEAAAKGKKKKLIMFGAIGFVAVAAIGGGAVMFLGKSGDKGAAAKAPEEEHGEKKADDHGEKKADDHGEKKADDHGEKKADDHGAKDDHGKKDGAKKDEKKADEHPAGDGIDFGQTYAFTPFHLNLGNPIDNHYVRLEVTVEYMGGAEQGEEIKRRLPQLRDAVVSVASRKTREFLLGPDGKDQLRLEIRNRINQYMTKKVENVYITDILIE